MRILIVNTYEKKGGAAIASNRLFKALKSNGVDVRELVQVKSSDDSSVETISSSFLEKSFTLLRVIFERVTFILHERSKDIRFAFSIANTGKDISKNHLVIESDIIHLHWINQGFLSLKSLKKIKLLNKPVVWTLHDMWAFTGGCHYSGECAAYESICMQCPFLRDPSAGDLSNEIFLNKKSLYKNFNITVVACSNWLKETASKSSLFQGFKIINIPNPINTEEYKPVNKDIARKQLNLPRNKKLIVFGAMNTTDKRKGFFFLSESLKYLSKKHPHTINEVELIVFGKPSEKKVINPYPCNELGILKSAENIVLAYSSADIYISPSLEDNLPNTIMESLSCSTPVVAFRTGGIPEMIDHKENGYLANYKSVEDLAEGIYWTLYKADNILLANNARKKVLDNYSEEIISQKYQELYSQILS